MTKLDLKQGAIAKQVCNMTNEEVLDQVMAVHESKSDSWFQSLTAMVRKEVEASLAQADRGDTVSHKEAMKLVLEWRGRQGNS